jgi:phage terminase large subunit-like protein
VGRGSSRLRRAQRDPAGPRRVFRSLSRHPASLQAALAAETEETLTRLFFTWVHWARPDQVPPHATKDGRPWHTWLLLGGRGSGKTRAGAEWVKAQALGPPHSHRVARRIALVGETIAQVRSVMIEGLSGLLAVHAPKDRPMFELAKNQLVWPNGAIAQMFAADSPESLRGPQFDSAWCDELCKWRRADDAWDNLQFALRVGALPQSVVTTTPRPIPLLKRIMHDHATVTSRSRTADNADHLAPAFLAEMQRRYGGTRSASRSSKARSSRSA